VADRSTLLVKLHDATIHLDRLERQSVLAAEDAQPPVCDGDRLTADPDVKAEQQDGPKQDRGRRG
jgi:hypothetical protein